MIKASELRVGNLLNWESEHVGGGVPEVIAISKIGYKVKSIHGCHPTLDEYDQINPIPLTPEWLGRCGFEYHMPYYIYGAFIVSENRYRDGSGNYDGFHMKVRIEDRIIPIVIRSIHQLQNLYFALTGEELNVKL